MSETTKDSNRREWMQIVGAGAAVAGSSLLASCGKEAQKAAAPLTATPRLQIFFHGMMIFDIDSPNHNIRVRIPTINLPASDGVSHVYRAGTPTGLKPSATQVADLKGNSYRLDGITKKATTSPAHMWDQNLHLFSSSPCMITAKPGSGSTPEQCTIEIPMPNEYHGCNLIRQTSLNAIFSGSVAYNCAPGLTSIPLIQVFRYDDFTQDDVTLVDVATNKPIWEAKKSGLKLHIYAEPDQKMNMPRNNAHLKVLAGFYKPPLDLDFSKIEEIEIYDDGRDGEIQGPYDLTSLVTLNGFGGDVADCINGYGS